MVAAFLKAESDSPRFGPTYAQIIQGQTVILAKPDLLNPVENRIRREALGVARGFGRNAYLFAGFPPNVQWSKVALSLDELGDVKYANYPTWVALSGGTRLVRDGAGNIDHVAVDEDANEHIRAIAEAVRAGMSFPELVAVLDTREDDTPILVEGHARATAYLVARDTAPSEIELILGCSDQMAQWAFY